MHLRRSTASRSSQLYREGLWGKSLVEASGLQAEKNQSPSDWIDYLDICHSIEGISESDWLRVSKQYQSLSFRSPKLLLRLLNLLVTNTLTPDLTDARRKIYCESLSSTVKPRWLATISDIQKTGYLGSIASHYPGLLLAKEDWIPNHKYIGKVHEPRRNLALSLAEHTLSFETLIQRLCSSSISKQADSPIRKIAVVGNSPVILDKTEGNEIDSADVVIRFNNVSNLKGTQRHTGIKTDLWVMSPSTPIHCCPSDARGVVVSGLNALTRPSFYWQKLTALERPVSEFSSKSWYELVRCFNAPPSAGTLLWASLDALMINVDIRSYGFTISQEDRLSIRNHHADLTPRSSRHNWHAETSWLADRLA